MTVENAQQNIKEIGTTRMLILWTKTELKLIGERERGRKTD